MKISAIALFAAIVVVAGTTLVPATSTMAASKAIALLFITYLLSSQLS